MKLMINREGCFSVNNKNRICPFDGRGEAWCGDWCALFKEPFERKGGNRTTGKTIVVLGLCQVAWVCPKEEFADEREVTDENP